MDGNRVRELAGRLGIDVDAALQQGMLEIEDLAMLLDAYAEMHEPDAAFFRAAGQGGDWQAVRERAHSLKGSSAALSAEGVRALAAELEAGIRATGSGDAAIAARLADAIESCVRAIREA